MERKHIKLLLVLLPVIAVILVFQVSSAVYLDLNKDLWQEKPKEEQKMEEERVVPETKDALIAYVKAEIQKLEAAGALTNDALTELFSECDAKGYIHLNKEGKSFITAKDGGEIMVSELSSAYVHRMTQKAFAQVIELSETYVEHRKDLEYGNYYTPFNDTTTNHIDCSSFVQLILYGIPYDTSRYIANENTARYDFGFAFPDNPYRNEFGPYRYLANDIGRYAFDHDMAFVPDENTQIQPGDIVFFSTNNRNEGYFMNITHVGICVEDKGNGQLYIVHGNSNDVANYYTIDLVNDRTPLGSNNAYKNSLVLIARYPVQADD